MRSTSTGQNVTTLRLATNRTWTDPNSRERKEATEYHTAIAWGRLAEIASQYLKRGGLVMLEGRLQTRSWQGQDNVKRYVTEIVVENLQLGPRSANASAGMSDVKTPSPAAAPVAPEDIPIINENEVTRPEVQDDEVKIKEEDLPF